MKGILLYQASMGLFQRLIAGLLLFPLITALPLDDYLNIDDGGFSWNKTDDFYNGTLRIGNWSAVALNVSTQVFIYTTRTVYISLIISP